MRLHDKPLPKFETSSSYEKYANTAPVMSGEGNALDIFEAHAKEALAHADDGTSEETTFEEKVNAVITCVASQNMLREILYKMLIRCQQPCAFPDLEQFIVESDEFVYGHVIQSPYTLINMLVRAGGIADVVPAGSQDGEEAALGRSSTVFLSEEATDSAQERQEAQPANDNDRVLEITEAGKAAAVFFDPDNRLRAQLAQYPHRFDTYCAVLEYCRTPRKFPQIKEFFETGSDLVQDVVANHHKLSPDFYVDKLEKAGALVWQGAWVTTDSGLRLLQERAVSGVSDQPAQTA